MEATQMRQLDLNHFKKILEQAPIAMAILWGPDFVVQLVNTRQMRIWDKQKEEVVNQPLFDIFPEVESQLFKEILTQVYETGKAFEGKEMPAKFYRTGVMETAYFNFTYEPFRNDSGEVEGITVVSIEVTDIVMARSK